MISILYVALILIFIKKSRFFNFENIKKLDIYLALLIQFSTGIILYIIYTKFYPVRYTSDIFKFYDDSLVLYNLFFENSADFFKILIGFNKDKDPILSNHLLEMNHWDSSYNNSFMNETRLLIKTNAILNIIGLKSYVFNMISFILIGFTGKLLIIKSVLKEFNLKNSKILFWSIFLLPSLLIWTSGILKEPLIIFSIGLITYFLSHKIKYGSLNLFLLILGSLIIFKVKFYVFICFLPALISFLISKKFIIKPYYTVFSFIAVIIISIGVLSKFDSDINPIRVLSKKQHDFIRLADVFEAGSSFNLTPLEPNFYSFLKILPEGILNGFLRPYPNNINKPLQFYPLLENLILYTCLFYFLYKLFKLKIKIKFGFKNALWNCLFFVTMLFIISGIGTPVLGALVRYKVPGLLFLIISINLIYDQLYKSSIN